MKKKMILCVVLLFSLVSVLNAVGPKYYYDYKNGYEGHSLANYVGTTKKFDISILNKGNIDYMLSCGSFVEPLSKLTKEENFLLWSALREFDIRDNEVYSVYIHSSSLRASTAVMLYVVIKENGNSVSWEGIRAE